MVEVDAEHAGQRLDNYLLRLCKGVPKTHIYKAIRGGEVRVNKGRIQADYRVAEGDIVRIPPLRLPDPGAPSPCRPPSFRWSTRTTPCWWSTSLPAWRSTAAAACLWRDRAVARRPAAGEIPGTGPPAGSGNLRPAHGRQEAQRAAGPCHAARGQGEKHYLALVEGDWVNDRQHIKLSLSKWTTQSGERRVKVDPDGQRAHTIVSLKQRFGGYSLVDAELRTGRTHQIRVHLASSGFPIVGDDKYGNDEVRAQFSRQGFGRMFLHAHRLTLAHPLTGETLTLTAELPRMPEVVETVGVCLMSMYTLVVFDWDGTLMDSTHSIVAAIQGACRDLELPVPSASDASWVIGLSLESALRRAVPS